MNTYLAIITTVLVLTQIIRVAQNHIQLRRQNIIFKKQLGDLANMDVQKEDFEIQRKAYKLIVEWLGKKAHTYETCKYNYPNKELLRMTNQEALNMFVACTTLDCEHCKECQDKPKFNEMKDMVISALEKQIPKKPIKIFYDEQDDDDWYDEKYTYQCPLCKENEVGWYSKEICEWIYQTAHCERCGQAIDWRNEDE